MTLTEIMQAIDELSPDELHRLQAYIQQREWQTHPNRGQTPAERVRRLEEAAAQIREGLTHAELHAMTTAMNAEYVEPFVDDIWKD